MPSSNVSLNTPSKPEYGLLDKIEQAGKCLSQDIEKVMTTFQNYLRIIVDALFGPNQNTKNSVNFNDRHVITIEGSDQGQNEDSIVTAAILPENQNTSAQNPNNFDPVASRPSQNIPFISYEDSCKLTRKVLNNLIDVPMFADEAQKLKTQIETEASKKTSRRSDTEDLNNLYPELDLSNRQDMNNFVEKTHTPVDTKIPHQKIPFISYEDSCKLTQKVLNDLLKFPSLADEAQKLKDQIEREAAETASRISELQNRGNI